MKKTSLLTQEPKVLKYWTLVEHLRKQITGGHLQPGDRAPSLAEMQTGFKVSRATVEKAYTLLEQDGLLVREQGRGTFVAELGPTPDTLTSTGLIGLLVLTRNPYHPYILQLLAGIRDEAKRFNLEVLWLDKSVSIPWEKVDGVLMYLGDVEFSSLRLPYEMPCVSLVRQTEGVSNVTADDFDGARQAVRHLLELGHRRIATLQSTPNDYFSLQRVAGYQKAFVEAGMEADSRCVRYIYDHLSGKYLEMGEKCMARWLEEDWVDLNCTAILATNDEAAIGIIKAFAKKGIRVPEDVSVVGFDGTEICEHSIPRLTTIEIPLHQIGSKGMQMLWEQIQGDVADERNCVLPARLKSGDSSAPLIESRVST